MYKYSGGSHVLGGHTFLDVGFFKSGDGNCEITTIVWSRAKNISKKGPRNCRSLGRARDDKGKGDGYMEGGYWTKAFFH
jgi:hypothetical protein